MTYLDGVFAISGAMGVAAPVAAAVIYRKTIAWDKDLAAPAWDFSRSWATNITAIGTVLGYATVLSSISHDATLRIFERSSYLVIAALATALVAASPVAFTLCRSVLRACRAPWASAAAFLVSAGITVCGLGLQLLLGSALIYEILALGYVPPWVGDGLVGLSWIMCAGVLVYAITSTSEVLKPETPPSRVMQMELPNVKLRKKEAAFAGIAQAETGSEPGVEFEVAAPAAPPTRWTLL
jgi:hypothetical protein